MTSLQRPEPQYKPPQAVATPTASLRYLSGNGPLQIAKAAISHLPTVTPRSVIHDNGCGDGNVTRVILSSRLRVGWPARIHATDIDDESLQYLDDDARQSGWPVTTGLVPAQELGYPDKSFTHSIMNCVLYRLSDADAITACQQMYRTLKPGGVAVVTVWAEVPHRMALQAAHKVTRPPGSEPLMGAAVWRWEDGIRLKKSLEAGGFKGRIKMEKAKAVAKVEDLEDWERQVWSTRGRMVSGWLPSDTDRWNEALRVFDAVLRESKDVEVHKDGNSATMTYWAWVAIAEKGRW